jgi:virginiamycin B lyase
MRTRLFAFSLSVLLAAGCGGQRATLPMPNQAPAAGVTPNVIQGNGSHWKQFHPHTSSGIYRGITAGPKETLWFSDQANLVRMSMTGGIHEFVLTFTEGGMTFGFGPIWLTTGADGKLYLGCGNCTDPTAGGGVIGVATTGGKLTVHKVPSKDIVGSNGLAVGPDGNVWFAEMGHIAKITPGGAVSEYAYPSGESNNTSSTPVTGPDGNVWFTEYFKLKVAKIVPSTHVITEFDVSSECSGPQGLAVGTDNKLYFNCSSNTLASITTAGVLGPTIANQYGTPNEPGDVITGPNGHIWFATTTTTLGEYNESNGTLTGHLPPFSTGDVLGLAVGSDTNIWGTDNDGYIDVYILAQLSVTPKSLTFTGIGQMQTLTASYNGPSTLSAVSADTSIATVSPGNSKNTFVVTSVGVGSTKITVEDAIGNLVNIPVTVQ